MKKIIYLILLVVLFLFSLIYKNPEDNSKTGSDKTVHIMKVNYLENQNKENKNV